MSQINYNQMGDFELKQYFLSHRNDRSAFQAYQDRRHQQSRQPILFADELDRLTFDEQIQLISERLKANFPII